MSDNNEKWLVVVNTTASIGKCGKDWPEIRNILLEEGLVFDDYLTEYQGYAIELVRNSIQEKGYRKVISVGGDGTNNEVINGIFTQNRFPTTEITMGVIPVGTGNDWRRTFGMSVDYRENVKIIKDGIDYAHDIGKVTYYNDGDPKIRYFLNGAGTGLDEAVCYSTNALKMKGKGGAARYMFSVAKCLWSYDCKHIQLEVDGKLVLDDEILSLSVGNGKYNGGGMMMMPNAVPNDGLFDITVIRKVGMLKFASNVSKVYDGTFVNHLKKEVSMFRGSKIRIVSIPSHNLLLETEGENLTNSPFDFEMLKQAIRMKVKGER